MGAFVINCAHDHERNFVAKYEILRNLKSEMWGTWRIISPLSEKVIAPMPPHLIGNCAHAHDYGQGALDRQILSNAYITKNA